MSPKGKNTPGPIGQEVAALIRERMARTMTKQAGLARATDIEPSRLSRMLYCKREMPVDDATKIARALDTSLAELMDAAIARLPQGTGTEQPGIPTTRDEEE